MARKSSGRSRRFGSILAAARTAISARVFLVVGVNLVVVALVLGALGGAAWGESWMKKKVADVRRPAATSLIINWPTIAGDSSRTWLPESARQEITRAAMTRVTSDVFDRASLEAARSALLHTGWFTSVDEIRRNAGGEVYVRASWRTPAAVVRWAGRDYLVAQGGELLPLLYERGGAGPTVRVIEGVEFGPPTLAGTLSGALAGPNLAFGQQWAGGEAQAALGLLAGLRKAFGETTVWSQIAGVDVSRVRSTGALAIITDTGSQVVWGAAPGKLTPGEQTVDQKLARLARLAKGPTGRIDAGERLVEIQGAHVFVDQSAGAASATADDQR